MRIALRLTLGLVALGCLAVVPATADASSKPVWICKPGIEDDPCKVGLRTTQLSHSGQELGIKNLRRAKRRRIDCFYVYPTVSDQPGPQANLDVDPELRSIALYQAARFSRDCRVYAPVYRQITLAGLGGVATEEMRERAYSDVLGAWKTYLRKHNRGRGVVLIGHSQGTGVLRRLAAEQIDPRRSARRRLVSALLLGGGVTVKAGEDAGGDFRRIEACRSRRQLGCVVGFSAFNGPVPEDSFFGRTSEPGLEVLCTNPATLGGRSGKLKTVYPSELFAPGTTIAAAISLVAPAPPPVSTPWLQYKGAYESRCSSADGASVLQITDAPGARHLNPVPDATWGLHLADATLGLGNLSDLVRSQSKAFVKKRG